MTKTRTTPTRSEPNFSEVEFGASIQVRRIIAAGSNESYVVQLALRGDWFVHLTRDMRWDSAHDEEWAPFSVSHVDIGCRVAQFHKLAQAIGAAAFMHTVTGGESMATVDDWEHYPRPQRLRWCATLLEEFNAIGENLGSRA